MAELLTLPITLLTTLCGSVSAMLPFQNLLPTSDDPLSDGGLGGYVVSVLCLTLCIFMIMKMPFKTPPIMVACCYALSSCSVSSSRIVRDVQRRVSDTKDE
jgi:hypothetical protein